MNTKQKLPPGVEQTLPIADYVTHLRAGRVLACPTETQFGLLADALCAEAVARVCSIKRRPESSPLALLLPSVDVLYLVAQPPPPVVIRLASTYWPGPLTLLLRARAGLSPALVKDGKIGVRVPGPSAALTIVQAFAGPLTATSANRSGEPVVADEAEARAEFGAELAAIVPGTLGRGLPSTIVDATGPELREVRSGVIPFVDIEGVARETRSRL